MTARMFAVLGMSLVGCAASEDADDKSPGHWTPGKGDGAYDLVEAGPADSGASIALDHRVPAYRIESYGNTKVQIDLKGQGGADPYLIVEGPLANNGDSVAIGGGTVFAEDDDGGPGRASRIIANLEKPGVYRILTGTFESLGFGEAAEGSLALTVKCSANCTRPSIDQKTFVRAMQAQGGPAFAEYAKAELAALVHDEFAAAALASQLDAILADPDLKGLERFPTMSLNALGAIRPALGAIPSDPPKPDQVVSGELATLLGACTADRSNPADIDARLPGVGYGHFPSKVLSPCQAAHADKLAQVLTSLAADNGSSITFRGRSITTPRALFAALIETGHTIEVRNERTYANFLSATVGDKDLMWPVWLDTGIRLSNGENFVIPMGHSHHAWRISGPNVNTRVMFYLGTSGAGFFGQTGLRPGWTGESTTTDEVVAKGNDKVEYLLATVDAAGAYLRRNRVERTTVAAGMPADGYGYVGVCNDSNTTIEYATLGKISAFPLLRAASLDSEAGLNDGLDDAVRALPKDADGLANVKDALRRAVLMQPHADGSPLIPDAKLAAQIAVARKDAAK